MIIAQSKLSLRFLITQHLGFLAKRSVLELNGALCLSLNNLLIVRVLRTVCITEVLGRERCVFGAERGGCGLTARPVGVGRVGQEVLHAVKEGMRQGLRGGAVGGGVGARAGEGGGGAGEERVGGR